jgi:hypothetical protein
MTQGRFRVLFIVLFGCIYFGLTYLSSLEKLWHFIFLIAFGSFLLGQYSMRFPKE